MMDLLSTSELSNQRFPVFPSVFSCAFVDGFYKTQRIPKINIVAIYSQTGENGSIVAIYHFNLETGRHLLYGGNGIGHWPQVVIDFESIR